MYHHVPHVSLPYTFFTPSTTYKFLNSKQNELFDIEKYCILMYLLVFILLKNETLINTLRYMNSLIQKHILIQA